MGTYITHEGLPFHGNLKKIRIRSCRATDPSLPGFDEEQLLEITQNGEVKLTQKTPTGTEKTKTRISQADADHIFAAFSEVFASYRRERIPSVSGHWRVRLLTDDNEVYFYHGANGQDYRYHDAMAAEHNDSPERNSRRSVRIVYNLNSKHKKER